jgi:DNA polymerase-3 subunit delta'
VVPFDAVLGQPTAVATLVRALESGRVHHAYRFEGPSGVGKELAAFAFAQALVCAAGARLGCGRCEACRRAVELSSGEPRTPLHPDVVLVERGLYPASVLGRDRAEVNEISVQQVRRVVLSQAGYPPHEGRARVFIVRAADELGPEAANALLKTLEEPRPATHFVLLTARPHRLLDTVRSRSLGVRFGPLPDETLAAILRARGVGEGLGELVALAAGSASAALEAADPERSAARQRFVAEVKRAVAGGLDDAVEVGEGAERDRHLLAAELGGLGVAYAREAREHAAIAPERSERAAVCHRLVGDAIDALERNASPALTLSSLVCSLARARQTRPGYREGARI